MPNAAITIRRPVDEVRAAWAKHFDESRDADFREAPRDQGTEVRVPLESDEDSQLALKVELRRFKQVLETGELVRSDGTPEGASVERLAKQASAQPPEEVPA